MSATNMIETSRQMAEMLGKASKMAFAHQDAADKRGDDESRERWAKARQAILDANAAVMNAALGEP